LEAGTQGRKEKRRSGKMADQLFCLRWNNHQSNLLSVFDQLLQVEAFCDVTLAVDGASLKCHKMVLAACSSYFQNLFMENTCKHPIVFLKDITFNQTRALLDYMYHGQVSVQEEELQGLLKVAEALKVKGLVESEDGGKGAASAKRTKSAPASKSSSSSGGKQPIWPVTTSKLLSPNKMGKSETDDDPGTLVIDEESSEANVTMSPLDTDYDMGYLNEDTPPAPGMVKTIGPNGKVEWKRYKQYTKDDILAAIEEVKNGMSALQASRKYGVPSRTLYDKVKKMGILTANMQKQLQQKKNSETPSKSENGMNSMSNFSPISLLGMQLPQSTLPTTTVPQVNGDPRQPITSPLLLSMIEKIKQAGLNKPALGDAPLNLSAMLDNESGEEASRSGSDGENNITIKQEPIGTEQADIRAQFFADLKRLNEGDSSNSSSGAASVIKPSEDESDRSSSHAVTLKIRDDENSFQSGKRSSSSEGLEENSKELKREEDLDSSIKLETTSC